MKLLNKVTPYSLKNAALCVMLATVMGGCKNDDPEPTPTKDIDIVFGQASLELVEEDAIKEILNGTDAKSIRTIYLVPMEGTWSNFNVKAMQSMRNRQLEPSLNLSPKVKGKGDFNFKLGEASKSPTDSLWYVKNGWTINKQYQK